MKVRYVLPYVIIVGKQLSREFIDGRITFYCVSNLHTCTEERESEMFFVPVFVLFGMFGMFDAFEMFVRSAHARSTPPETLSAPSLRPVCTSLRPAIGKTPFTARHPVARRIFEASESLIFI